MGVLYLTSSLFGRGVKTATYENGKIICKRFGRSYQKIIAKYDEKCKYVTEAYSDSSQTLGTVHESRGYLTAPYITSTTPFIYADDCNRIFTCTGEYVGYFEGDMAGALLAYIAYYCNCSARNPIFNLALVSSIVLAYIGTIGIISYNTSIDFCYLLFTTPLYLAIGPLAVFGALACIYDGGL